MFMYVILFYVHVYSYRNRIYVLQIEATILSYVHVNYPISIWNLKSTIFNYNLIFTIYNAKIQNFSLQKFAITNYKRMIYGHLILQTIHGNNSIFTVYNHKNHHYSLQNFTLTIKSYKQYMGTKNLNKIQFHDFIHTYINTSMRIVHTYSIHT